MSTGSESALSAQNAAHRVDGGRVAVGVDGTVLVGFGRFWCVWVALTVVFGSVSDTIHLTHTVAEYIPLTSVRVDHN